MTNPDERSPDSEKAQNARQRVEVSPER